MGLKELFGGNVRPIPQNRLKEHEDILENIVNDTRNNGQWRIACRKYGVKPSSIEQLLIEGESEINMLSTNPEYEPGIAGYFYVALNAAQATHASSVIDMIHDLAEGDPEYKNFWLWIVENLIEGKPFARFQRTENVGGQAQVVIINQAVTGEQWVHGIDGAAERRRMIEAGVTVEEDIVEDF